jgi:hypothetical protein
LLQKIQENKIFLTLEKPAQQEKNLIHQNTKIASKIPYIVNDGEREGKSRE